MSTGDVPREGSDGGAGFDLIMLSSAALQSPSRHFIST
jgi:hypothetical protein